MNRQISMYLLVFSSFTFVCICGKHPGLPPSCEDRVFVRRNLVKYTATQKSLTIECPTQHCGKPVNITWCKFIPHTYECQKQHNTENVEIRQEDQQGHKVTSYLTFRNISLHDDGLYRCSLKGEMGHKIQISVSDLYEEFPSVHNDAVAGYRVADDDAHTQSESWMPYFLIVFGVALVVAMLAVITLGRIPCWKRVLTVNPTETQEMASHVIPNLPKASAPPIASLQANFCPQDGNYSPNAVRPTLRPPLTIRMNQHDSANPANPNQRSQFGLYATINRQPVVHSGEQREQATAPKDPQYAAIKFT